MNPLASGVFFDVDAGIKYRVSVCVVSPLGGMGGSDDLCWPPGACADAVLTPACNTNITTKEITGNRDVCFLFIIDFLLVIMIIVFELSIRLCKPTKRSYSKKKGKVN